MWRRRASSLMVGVSFLLLLPAFRSAKMEVPASLAASAETLPVSGHNPRTWNRPLAFGPYQTSSVREGLEFSWSVQVFGVRGGQAKKPYRLVFEGPEGAVWEIQCLTRSVEAWRGGWSVELTEVFAPRLVCGLHERSEERPGERTFELILSSTGRQLRGVVQKAGSSNLQPPLLTIRSVHRLEGSRLPLEEPAGYVVEGTLDGAKGTVAAVETLNRGRVWLAADPGNPAAAAVAALLLYKPELSPQE